MRVTTARDRTERAAGLKTFVRLLTDEDLDVQRAALLMVNAAVLHPAFSRAKTCARDRYGCVSCRGGEAYPNPP